MAPSSRTYQSDRHTLGKIIKAHSMKSPDQVNRRNERERKRVQNLNNLYHTLAAKLSLYSPAKNKKFSKKETLRTAIEYIKYLEKVLENDEEFDEHFLLDAALSSPMDANTSSSASSTHSLENSFCYSQTYGGETKMEPSSPPNQLILSSQNHLHNHNGSSSYDSSTNSSPNYPCQSSYTTSLHQPQHQQLQLQQQTYYSQVQSWKGSPIYHPQVGNYYMATTTM